jgi:predicted DNA-binding ribbon-helix-helix protein
MRVHAITASRILSSNGRRRAWVAATHMYTHITGMKTTMDLPDELYRNVKTEAARRGMTVREVTTALYAAWLDGRTSVSPAAVDEAAVTAWVARMDALSVRAAAADPNPAHSMLDQLRIDRDARG